MEHRSKTRTLARALGFTALLSMSFAPALAAQEASEEAQEKEEMMEEEIAEFEEEVVLEEVVVTGARQPRSATDSVVPSTWSGVRISSSKAARICPIS